MKEIMDLLATLPPETGDRIKTAMGRMIRSRLRQEQAEKVERYRRLNKFVQPGQILFAGSSLMEQFPINELIQPYQLPLKIYNRGVGGFTTTDMLEVMGPCVYDLNPKYIFLNIGTNDLNAPDLTEGALIGRYEKILDGIREHLPQAKVTLLAYYPVNEEIGLKNPAMGSVFRIRTNERICRANAAVEQLARRRGLDFLNLNSGITDPNGNQKAEYTIEGMHMYADGYHEVLKLLLPTLKDCV